jgi:peptide/nickel transport system permease protein
MSQAATVPFDEDIPRKSFLALAWRRFLRHHLALLGALIVLLLVGMAVLAPWLAPHDPNKVDIMSAREGPSSEHILGCDVVGRDVLSRLVYGTRVSLSVGLVAVAIGVLIGTVLGCIAGYFGGLADMLISRLIDAVLSFPPLMLILVIVGLLGPRLFNIMLVLGSWAGPRWPGSCGARSWRSGRSSTFCPAGPWARDPGGSS